MRSFFFQTVSIVASASAARRALDQPAQVRGGFEHGGRQIQLAQVISRAIAEDSREGLIRRKDSAVARQAAHGVRRVLELLPVLRLAI